MTINNDQLNTLEKFYETVIQKCPFVSKQTKINSRVKTVFPGQQSFGNCGIEASRQLVELTTCKQLSESESLQDALRNNEANLEFNDPSKLPTAEEKEKIINDIGDKDKVRSNGIDTSKTGGSDFYGINSFVKRNGGETKVVQYDRAELSKAVKNNQPVIFAANAEDLAPGYDENGEEIETWRAKNEYKTEDGKIIKPGDPLGVGGHAILITGGEYDKSGNLTKVHINDTGCGKRYTMKVEDFEKAKWHTPDGNNFMVVSTKPIKESCP